MSLRELWPAAAGHCSQVEAAALETARTVAVVKRVSGRSATERPMRGAVYAMTWSPARHRGDVHAKAIDR